MAEPFGVVAGAVGIAAVFTTCVDCFGYIQSARHSGRDIQTELITLRLLGLRLSRWGEAIQINNDPKLGNESDERIAKETLMQILVLFADSKKTSTKYSLTVDETDNQLALAKGEFTQATLDSLDDKVRQLTAKRQKGISLLKKTTWALHDRESFGKLVTGISSLMDELERLFPAQAMRDRLADGDVKEVADRNVLECLEKLSSTIDLSLQEKAKKELAKRHLFKKISVEAGRVHNGDFFDSSYDGKAGKMEGGGSTFDEIRINGAEAKVQNGDKFGGAYFLD